MLQLHVSVVSFCFNQDDDVEYSSAPSRSNGTAGKNLYSFIPPGRKKTCHFIIAANFAKCGPIFKSLSPTDLAVSVQ